MADKLTHTDEQGEARMVDIGDKSETARTAIAEGTVRMSDATLALVKDNRLKKGDVLSTARIAGIMAAKKTSEIIPLCHPLNLSSITVSFDFIPSVGIRLEAGVKTDGKTGVEMEALTAVSAAALTIYDMIKAVENSAQITDIQLLYKEGGKSGIYERGAP